jgi:hypothetical protein
MPGINFFSDFNQVKNSPCFKCHLNHRQKCHKFKWYFFILLWNNYWLGHMPSLLNHGELNQYILKSHFWMVPLPYKLWLWVCDNMPSGMQHYLSMWCSRVNTLQIWIQNWHNQNQKIFFSLPRFEPKLYSKPHMH